MVKIIPFFSFVFHDIILGNALHIFIHKISNIYLNITCSQLVLFFLFEGYAVLAFLDYWEKSSVFKNMFSDIAYRHDQI